MPDHWTQKLAGACCPATDMTRRQARAGPQLLNGHLQASSHPELRGPHTWCQPTPANRRRLRIRPWPLNIDGEGPAALPQISESRCLFNHGLFYGNGFRRRSLPLSFTDPVRAAAQAGNGEGSNHYNQHPAHQAILSPGAEQPIESPQIKRYAAPPS
ncbi:hypothetical protein MES5069_30174 [Mesorhizobium escarrei]|uniref:Uncharacterized protein n=1 Tax=Mesorhizobium escarrei TaxID=666018 RepID=A0ABM9DZY0_9HYPH|nr:hypothetical protein MES5069_30174 [Mesorhizobium escarrei]